MEVVCLYYSWITADRQNPPNWSELRQDQDMSIKMQMILQARNTLVCLEIYCNMSDKCEEKRPHVAIIGSGLVGVILALGLLKRNIKVTLYEQSHDLNELGAGIAFTGVAQECMRQLDPRILEALRRVGNENVTAYNRYVDGYSQVTGEQREEDSTFEPLFFQLPIDGMKFWACHRAHFLNELAKLLPGNVIVFQKRLATYVDDENRPTVMLHFEDGSMAEADAGESIQYI